jgi:TonB family protein
MSIPTELWKNWEGREVDDKFPLRQWLGSSDHSAVFLTQRTGTGSQRAVIKLIRVETLDEDAQLSRWAAAAKLSHPHLIRLFERGRCLIDGTRLLYVVMEYADENLAEILPLRALSPEEACEMLLPAAGALAYLHQSGYAHGRIRPSNIVAVDNQLKISADGIGRTGKRSGGRAPSVYDAPEVASAGVSPASDVWALGVTLVTILTRNEPKLGSGDSGLTAVPETIPQPLREIAQQCLQADPQQRCTVTDILGQVRTQALQTKASQAPASRARDFEIDGSQPRSKRWIIIPVIVAALILIVWMGGKFMSRTPAPGAENHPAVVASTPVAETHPAVAPPPTAQPHPASTPARVQTPAAKSPAPPAPSTAKQKPVQNGVAHGSVLQQVLPDVSQGARATIQGHIKVSVQVSVDSSGKVSQTKLVSPGPSKYFANHALAAANRWKFTPPQIDGQAAASEWVLRFQFGRAGTQVVPQETKP